MDEKITIIVPVYKVEKYLKKCVDSILAQTYRNLEIILVDDGSPDQCPEICDMLQTIDSRIVVIHQMNAGLSAARNAGLDIATGTYIMFVDSDDYIDKNMCEALYSVLATNHSDLAMCSFEYVDEFGKNVCEDLSAHCRLTNETINKRQALEKISHQTEGYWFYVVAWNKLYKRELFEHYRFPNDKIHEDEFAIHHIFLQCDSVSIIKDKLYSYIQRDNSIMGNKQFSVKRVNAVEAMIDRFDLYKAFGYQDLSKDALITAYWVLCEYLSDMPDKSFRYTCKDVYHKVLNELIHIRNLRAFKLILKYVSV